MRSHFTKFITLTKLEQTLFGLPFVLIGAALPFGDKVFMNQITPNIWIRWFFILPAFIAARIAGMAWNQYLDRHIDALNPRTNHRLLPKKLISPEHVLRIACLSLLFFVMCSLCIHKLCFFVSLCSAFLIVLYSFMKKIHYTCHLILGLIHFLAPLTAFIAVKQTVDLSIIFLSFIPLCMHAGNDIIYALQDYAFDCKQKLHSIPSHFGIAKSVKISLFLQACCIFFMILFGYISHFSWIYYGAPCVALCAFYLFHKFWKKSQALLYTNITISISMGIFTMMASLWRG